MVAEWLGKELILDENVWQHIQNILSGRGFLIRDFQKQQALFPEGARVMENSKGTAHGFHVSGKGKEIFVVPGPPKEVQSVFENYLRTWISSHSQASDSEITEIWNTLGIGESEVAFQIENLIKGYERRSENHLFKIAIGHH
jgi:molybdopterin-biosynthesis enzyme MoeA-like protein